MSAERNYQICVSGAAAGKTVRGDAKLATKVGETVARRGHTLITGATTGLPDFAAKGAKSKDGRSVGISPAPSLYSHVHEYKLPTESYDIIIHSGLDFIGRDVLLVQSSDAVISLGGRIGTLHEFAVAMELRKPIGVVSYTGGTSQLFDELLSVAGADEYEHLYEDEDPVRLVDTLIGVLDDEYNELHPDPSVHDDEIETAQS